MTTKSYFDSLKITVPKPWTREKYDWIDKMNIHAMNWDLSTSVIFKNKSGVWLSSPVTMFPIVLSEGMRTVGDGSWMPCRKWSLLINEKQERVTLNSIYVAQIGN